MRIEGKVRVEFSFKDKGKEGGGAREKVGVEDETMDNGKGEVKATEEVSEGDEMREEGQMGNGSDGRGEGE